MNGIFIFYLTAIVGVVCLLIGVYVGERRRKFSVSTTGREVSISVKTGTINLELYGEKEYVTRLFQDFCINSPEFQRSVGSVIEHCSVEEMLAAMSDAGFGEPVIDEFKKNFTWEDSID